ncbi:MAG: hypothetical protein IKI84_13345 [Clostridia bacterium]|nr:hypothetical protein [Clostridia bacterium]
MSMVQQMISAIVNAQRQIDDQIMKLRSYLSEIEKTSARVHNALEGSTLDYESRMQAQLARTRQQVEESIGRLQDAKEKLQRVRMI